MIISINKEYLKILSQINSFEMWEAFAVNIGKENNVNMSNDNKDKLYIKQRQRDKPPKKQVSKQTH